MKKYLLTMIAALLFSVTVQAADAGLHEQAPDFTLLDQQGQPFHLGKEKGSLVILLASDRAGREQTSPWRRSLDERYKGGIVTIGIADLRSVPFFMKSVIRNSFRKDGVRILMDWQGEVFRQYGFLDNVANVALIDKKGIVRYLCSGEGTAAALESLFREIDRRNGD